MKVVVMSDSHGINENLNLVLEKEKDADYFLHLGDLCSPKEEFPQLVLVRGNNDWDFELPDKRVVEYEGLKILMLHSHNIYGLGKHLKLAELAKKNDCKICLFGHTHEKFYQKVDDILLINPGSLCYNRDYTDIGYVVLDIKNANQFDVIWKEL